MIAYHILHNKANNYTDHGELVGNCDILLDSSTTHYALMAEKVHAIAAGKHLHSTTIKISCVTQTECLDKLLDTIGLNRESLGGSKHTSLKKTVDHATIYSPRFFLSLCKSQTAKFKLGTRGGVNHVVSRYTTTPLLVV